jgi:transposase
MRIAPAVVLSEQQRTTLEVLARGRRIPARLVERARIVLLTAEGQQDSQIAEVLSIPRQKAARWRKRFLAHGIAGLEKDAPRPGRPTTITEQTIQDVVTRTTQTRPANATHWSTRTMAQVVDISEASVRRIWKLHGLKPHRVESFKLSNDPRFAEKLQDVIGLYLHPPEHALVLSLDEKSQIQALDRTQPGLPLKKGRCQTMTHDYKQHGTTTLFAALNVARSLSEKHSATLLTLSGQVARSFRAGVVLGAAAADFDGEGPWATISNESHSATPSVRLAGPRRAVEYCA